MVHRQFGHSSRVSPAVSDFDGAIEKIWDAVLAPEQDARLSAPLDSGNSEQSSSVESPADPRTPSSRHSRLSTPLSSPPDSPPAVDASRVTPCPAETVPGGDGDPDGDPDSGVSEDGRYTRILRSRGTPQSVDPDGRTLAESDPAADQRATSPEALARLRPRQDKPAYREAPPRNAKPVDRRPVPPALDLPVRRCCPPKIPPELLTVLDRWDASATGQILHTFMSPDVPLEDMCRTHLRKFAEAVKPPPGAETIFQVASFDRGTSSRRRRASLPDLLDTTPLKRPRLGEQDAPAYSPSPTPRQSGFPTLDLVYHEAYRQQVLRESATKQHKPGSWGHKTYKLVSQILRRIRPPTDREAYFLSGEEAARKVELGSLDAPIFTEGQQRFQWPGKDRPINQVFRFMEDLGLDRYISVQDEELSVRGESFKSMPLHEVRDEFLCQDSTDNPLTLLDLETSLPPVVPAFLEGENCQLLRRVRGAALMGGSAERMAASGEDWSTWRNVIEWGLVSQGGNTAPHMDSHAYSTWLTVQEGEIAFGWMSRPSRQEEAEWMSRPESHTTGEWRFVVLRPGQTVFFPSGTIHLVFRKRGVQTYAQGGHILQWSDLVRWLEVVIAQMQNMDSTNRCDQFVRHTSIVIPPSRLRAENIDFVIFRSGPGEMVLTEPGQYHAVINWTRCGAIAINFTLPGEDPIPQKLSVCDLDGLYHLKHPRIQKLRDAKRKEHDSQLERLLRNKRLRLAKPLQIPIVEVLVRETTSRDAILRFMAVVCAWRKVHDDLRGRLSLISTYDKSCRPVALDTLRTMLQGVKHVQHLCEVGRAFESQVFGREDFPERLFEAEPGKLSALSLGDLLRML